MMNGIPKAKAKTWKVVHLHLDGTEPSVILSYVAISKDRTKVNLGARAQLAGLWHG